MRARSRHRKAPSRCWTVVYRDADGAFVTISRRHFDTKAKARQNLKMIACGNLKPQIVRMDVKY